MKNTRLVNALVGMGSKIITLRLYEVGWQPLAAIGIEVGKGAAESGYGNAGFYRFANHTAEACFALLQQCGHAIVQ